MVVILVVLLVLAVFGGGWWQSRPPEARAAWGGFAGWSPAMLLLVLALVLYLTGHLTAGGLR